MFRMWGKIWKENHLVQDTVIAISDYSMSRTQMVFQSLEDICYELDLGSQSGWNQISAVFSSMTKPGFLKTVLLNQLILTIWKSRLSKNNYIEK